ncbi:MAG TPA: VWA domain-containing protein [Terriglobales bacterium]|nr:VWA domain-containing protein [Terriglobales bacterium]
MKRWLLLAALLPGALSAQGSRLTTGSRAYIPHEVRLRAETNLVQIAVTVRDSSGRPVAGLTAADFELLDRGKRQIIGGFSVESSPSPSGTESMPSSSGAGAREPVPQPQNVALFFDDNSMGTADLTMARNQAEKYLRSGMPSGRRIGVFTSSGIHQLVFSGDADQVLAAVRKLGVELRMGPTGQAIGAVTIEPYVAYMAAETGGTYIGILATDLRKAGLCFDPTSCRFMASAEAQSIFEQTEQSSSDTFAALQRAIAALASQSGRRTLLLTSSGFLSATSRLRAREEEVISAALQAGVVIDTLDATLLQTVDPAERIAMRGMRLSIQEADRDPLYELAAATGGDFFHDNNDLAGALRNNSDGPRVRYLLSFSPPDMKHDGAFHGISVKLARGAHGQVQARKGYFDPDPALDPFGVLPQALLDRELLGTDDRGSLPAEMAVEAAAAAGGGSRLTLSVRVKTDRLPFVHQDGFSVDNLGFAIAVFGPGGQFIAGKQGIMELRLTKQTLLQFDKTGVAGNLSLMLPVGVYRLRELVRESNRGEMSILTRRFEVPEPPPGR